MHHPYLLVALSIGKRLAWTAFGASLATAVFALRAPLHAVPGAAPPVNVVAKVVVPPLRLEAPPAAAPLPASPALGHLDPAFPRRALGPVDVAACGRAWSSGGIYHSEYGITYVTREVVDATLESQAELMRSARIVPEQIGDHVVGIRLFGVRPDSLTGRLGLQNGDSLRTIDGFDLTTPDHALEAYASLRTARDYHLGIVRMGQHRTLVYRVC